MSTFHLKENEVKARAIDIDTILLHPLFWTRKKMKEFLCNLSDVLRSNSNKRREFNRLFSSVVAGPSWIDQLDDTPKTYCEKKTLENENKKLYYGSSLYCLLRAVRNLARHLDEEYAADPETYFGVDTNLENEQNNGVNYTTETHERNGDKESAESGKNIRDKENECNTSSNQNGKNTQSNANGNHEQDEGNTENQNGVKKQIKYQKITLKEKLAPCFGESADDSLAYWLHKFPQLLPVCYLFAQDYEEMRSKDNYYLDDELKAKLNQDKHCNFVGIFNELYACTTNVMNHEKLLGQYTVGTEGHLKFLKIHPWVLGEHSLIEIKYLQGKVVLRKRANIGKLKDSQNGNKTIDVNGRKCSEIPCNCTDLWKSKEVEFHGSALTQENLVVVLCGRAEVGLKHAYCTNRYTTKSVVILTEDSYPDVAQSMEKFQIFLTRQTGKQANFVEKTLRWSELEKTLQKALLEVKLHLQHNVETLRDLVDLDEQDFSNKILCNMDNFVFHLIHAREMRPPQIIRDIETLSDKTVEMTRTLSCVNNLNLFQLGEAHVFTGKSLCKNTSSSKILNNTKIMPENLLSENDLLTLANESSRHVLISGGSGIGKSTLLHRLANKMVKEARSFKQKTIVAFLQFPEIVKALNPVVKGRMRGLSKKALSKVIADAITSSRFCSKLVTPIVSGSGARNYIIFLLLDAFDEVAAGQRDTCIRLLELLYAEFPHVRIWATTRKENTTQVETILQAITFNLLLLNYGESKRFLINYWLKRNCEPVAEGEPQEQQNILQDLADICVDAGEPNLLGSPFCLMLIAEVCLESTPRGGCSLAVENLPETKFEDLNALINKFDVSNMTSVSSKQYQPGMDSVALSESISVWYKKERNEMLMVRQNNEGRAPAVYQFSAA